MARVNGPVVVPVALRWSDMDAYGHVNNTEVYRLLEQARIDGLPVLREPGISGYLVVRHEIEYLRPVTYDRHGVTVRMWCTGLGGAGFDLGYEVMAGVPGTEHARAATTMVAMDLATGVPRRLTGDERDLLDSISGPPVAFRRGSR